MRSASRLLRNFKNGSRPGVLRVLGASGQLGYGIPQPAFAAGLEREPHLIGCDMGSIDIGPYYLGAGEMATSAVATKRDLTKVIRGARQLNVPLVIGSAGSAGARPHLEQTLKIVREIAREEGLRFRLGVLRADIDRPYLKAAIRNGAVSPIDGMAALTENEVDGAANIVGQMGTEAISRALEAGADVVIAGRACDTAIFAALPILLGFPAGAAMHMAKIIECASLCCVPGGRDAIMASLDDEGFELESMAPQRRATPVSVAAHSLYEQSDPNVVMEPEGRLDLSGARYEALDDRRTRVVGGLWDARAEAFVKIEGARMVGHRAVLLAAAADKRFIENHRTTLRDVEGVVRDLVCESAEEDYQLIWRVYGIDGVCARPNGEQVDAPLPSEVFILVECLAPTAERAAEVVRTAKQYLLHHGYPGRLTTGGNLAFPFTPPEVITGPAYRFNVYHLVRVDDLAEIFPLELEDL